MRKLCWAALVVGLGMAAPARAQTRTLLPFGSLSGQQTTNAIVDPAAAGIPIAQPQTFSRTFNLLNFLPKISSFSNRTVIGSSTFPTPEQMPGRDYLRHFGFSRPQPIR